MSWQDEEILAQAGAVGFGVAENCFSGIESRIIAQSGHDLAPAELVAGQYLGDEISGDCRTVEIEVAVEVVSEHAAEYVDLGLD